LRNESVAEAEDIPEDEQQNFDFDATGVFLAADLQGIISQAAQSPITQSPDLASEDSTDALDDIQHLLEDALRNESVAEAEDIPEDEQQNFDFDATGIFLAA
ncbi:hypothetical protein RZS08_66835, partial [Arthrospira platensis SPKY1]|nr:hypothetical protein [Arthrospira platensis SPKY1]